MHNNLSSAVFLIRYGDLIFAVFAAYPVDRRGVGIRLGVDLYRAADHKSRVESKSEMTDYAVFGVVGLIFVFLYEIHSARKCNAADIFGKLFLGHTDTVVGYRKRFSVLVDRHGDSVILVRALAYSERGKAAELGYSVCRV